MTEMIEGLALTLEMEAGEKCPVCNKSPHDTVKEKKSLEGDLSSKPRKLGCKKLSQIQDAPNFSTAAHHIIPANQCLKQFQRLSQMCKVVGYDVNNHENGMPLPTHGGGKRNTYKGKKYGKLLPSEKTRVSFEVMAATNSQWHVGHHAWNVEGLIDTTDSDAHISNYDQLVKLCLRQIERQLTDNGEKVCSPPKPKESGEPVIDRLNRLSGKLKKLVVAFNAFFVSRLSAEFGRDRLGRIIR